MAEYQAHLIGADGHFIKSIQLLCANDESAKEYAKQFVDGHDIELWQQDGLIAKFESE